MNQYAVSIVAIMFLTIFLAALAGLRYSQASLVFGIIAAVLAPIAIHKVPKLSLSVAFLVSLAIFASYPAKKLFQLNGFFQEFPLTLAYAALLWFIGIGWKRSWKREK